MSKEVLISQRQGAQPAGGGGGAGPSNAAPVSNYKGVMLCDRPGPKPMGATGGGGGMAGGEPVPFLSSVVPKEQVRDPFWLAVILLLVSFVLLLLFLLGVALLLERYQVFWCNESVSFLVYCFFTHSILCPAWLEPLSRD
mmetsp:Transcript_10576/g.27696  ORF Transcript_10576/g.27696 Transcript_10576/m.27696 type:complete len:140 (+) Transcript_10576:76-495(+)